MIKLNDIKSQLYELAMICGFLESELSIDYSLDLDEELSNELEKLIEMFSVVKKALAEKDMLAVQSSLIVARIYTMNLRNFFNDICEDIELIGWTDRFDWPEIPNEYQIPDYYKHSDK